MVVHLHSPNNGSMCVTRPAGDAAPHTSSAVLQEDEALQALRIISAALSTAQLKHLNLSDNALGEKGLRASAAAFQHPVG